MDSLEHQLTVEVIQDWIEKAFAQEKVKNEFPSVVKEPAFQSLGSLDAPNFSLNRECFETECGYECEAHYAKYKKEFKDIEILSGGNVSLETNSEEYSKENQSSLGFAVENTRMCEDSGFIPSKDVKRKVCGMMSDRRSYLQHHIAVHSDARNCECDVCSKGFKRVNNSVAHRKIHSKKFVKCHLCRETVENLHAHLRVHTGANSSPSNCKTLCTKENVKQKHSIFYSGSEPLVPNAVPRAGNDVKPRKDFSCEICDQSFGRKDHLLRHQTMHSDARPFICTECGKAFKRLDSLRQHRKSHLKKTVIVVSD